jgi:hypothetical protein
MRFERNPQKDLNTNQRGENKLGVTGLPGEVKVGGLVGLDKLGVLVLVVLESAKGVVGSQS